MPRGGARPGAGAKPLPVEQRRVPVKVTLPPAAVKILRDIALLTGDSQADVIAHALQLYDAEVRRPPPRKRVHAIVV